MNLFKLILEEGCPVAAIVPWTISDRQLDIIYCMLPEHCVYQPDLAVHWCMPDHFTPRRSNIFSAKEMMRDRILASDGWAQQQFHRKAMPKFKTVDLAFVAEDESGGPGVRVRFEWKSDRTEANEEGNS